MTATITPASTTKSTLPAVGLTLGSMSIVQIGLAVSTGFFDRLSPAGTTWLRLTWAAVILLVVVRPKPWRYNRSDLLGVLALGVVSAGMTMFFAEAVSRIPLSAAASIGFLGPLSVGVARRAGKWGLLWPPIALVGVVLVTEPWRDAVNLPGVLLACGNACCWAMYILLTQKVGDRLPGLSGLALSMTVGSFVAATAGLSYALPRLTWDLVLIGAGLALLIPVLPYAMEMLALRRIAVGAFGTLLSLEPAIALIVGLVLLQQIPTVWQVGGIALVTFAAIGAARAGRRMSDQPVV